MVKSTVSYPPATNNTRIPLAGARFKGTAFLKNCLCCVWQEWRPLRIYGEPIESKEREEWIEVGGKKHGLPSFDGSPFEVSLSVTSDRGCRPRHHRIRRGRHGLRRPNAVLEASPHSP